MGQPVKNIITEESFNAFQSAFFASRFKTKVPLELTFTINGSEKGYLALIHEKDDLLLVEVEFADALENKKSFINVFQQVKQVMAAVDAAGTIREVCDIAAYEIKKISGFDKVMIYTFDEDWNGTVVAEAMEKEMDSYFGLKFPASDIPKPARDLYFKNPFRLIPDINNYHQAAGVMYVLEGSTLGGQYITQMLLAKPALKDHKDAMAFFRGYEQENFFMWEVFKHHLQANVEKEEDIDAVVQSAIDTFSLLDKWILKINNGSTSNPLAVSA